MNLGGGESGVDRRKAVGLLAVVLTAMGLSSTGAGCDGCARKQPHPGISQVLRSRSGMRCLVAFHRLDLYGDMCGPYLGLSLNHTSRTYDMRQWCKFLPRRAKYPSMT